MQVSRLRGELHREHDRKLQEMKEASRRMKEDYDHQVELERYKRHLISYFFHFFYNQTECERCGQFNSFTLFLESARAGEVQIFYLFQHFYTQNGQF